MKNRIWGNTLSKAMSAMLIHCVAVISVRKFRQFGILNELYSSTVRTVKVWVYICGFIYVATKEVHLHVAIKVKQGSHMN